MEIGDLYQFVLALVLIGMVLGIGILVLDKFAATTGLTTASKNALSNTSAALGTIATSWLSIIVIVVVCAIILGLVIRSFMNKGR